jgi:hypothetical protein
MADTYIPLYDGDDRTDRKILYHGNPDGSHSPTAWGVGGVLQCGHIAVLTNGEGVDATEDELPGAVQVVHLPDIPCRKVVLGFPTAAALSGALGAAYPDGSANDAGRLLYVGDEGEQAFALEVGQAEEFEVSNANQIYLRDVGFAWEDFNGDGHLSSYFLVVLWRVIK